ncbi:ribonucleoside-triphosphate reductase, adenosylcobalamin-dependent [Nocardia cyriacigeorgica]|uniref:ribonucleoside-triphosphate reductase, adenosylcobalamin-dependent n=1 Tax=Nocardia cyriacigeorgica TaxID=135487 RepID=UPI0018950757|nr:ribonucleoside-triphosphate reductase, adenosylcobalamin-dependent [Nocardia cyriacigeorgica]MBF6287144.1 ribonucleoside-triphosphate reductase, adenosylcobalamin-dependent [Nocardia cyriacigeorgica]
MSEVGEAVYLRTYSRTKPDGSKETWEETVERVVDGNLALVDSKYHQPNEREDLKRFIRQFIIIPAGRHLWASGVKGAQHLMNCWVSGWTENPWDHFEFTFMRLMEGGGVGSNYSNRFLRDYPLIQHPHRVEIVCDPEHQDFQDLREAGVISHRYSPDWDGAFVIEDSREGWAAALVDLIQTYYRPDTQHFHRVYDVSRVRPAGARLKTFGGTASGPLPLAKMLIDVEKVFNDGVGRQLNGIAAMYVDHAIAQCVVAGGVRRSARMAMMHWADPQIMEFIRIKQDSGSHWTTNISVEVDSEFWEIVKRPAFVNAVDASSDHAREVLSAISEGMVHNGEPGFWDSSLSNVGEPNEVISCNPCAEICLEAWEPCNLGHVNLAAFVNGDGDINYPDLYRAHELMTRFLIRATFAPVSDPKSREVLDRNRRIGVGHLGVASYLAMRGIKYSDADIDHGYDLQDWASVVDRAAEEYAHQLRIPVPVKKRTVAPTGTIAKMPGVSEGIHPIFSKYFIRRIRFSKLDPDQAATLERYKADGYKVEDCLYADNTAVVEIPTKDSLVQAVEDIHGAESAQELVQGADELLITNMLEMQAMYQKYWADNAVSYTANIYPGFDPERMAKMIQKFGGRLKGMTVFPESSMAQAPYERISKEEYESATAKDVADGVDENCASGACPIR